MSKVWKRSLEHSVKPLKAVNMSKASLGQFIYWACKLDADVGTVWAFNARYERCWVGVTLHIEEAKIKEFEEKSGFGLMDPQKVKLA